VQKIKKKKRKEKRGKGNAAAVYGGRAW